MSDLPTTFSLGLLDFAAVSRFETETYTDRLFALVELASLADTLGYSRYWLGEHHHPAIALGSPEIMLALLAGSTNRIKVGAGAMLLYYHSPMRIAESFALLEAMFRGRVELGVGRSRADNDVSHVALLDGNGLPTDGMLDESIFRQKVADVAGLLSRSLPESHRYEGAVLNPRSPGIPDIWCCGTSSAGKAAAANGIGFCLSLFHGRQPDPSAVALYRDEFRAVTKIAAPRVIIAVLGACADSEEGAQGIRNEWENRLYLPTIVGTASQCYDGIVQLVNKYEADEVLFMDMAQRHDQRRTTCHLLSEQFRLTTSNK